MEQKERMLLEIVVAVAFMLFLVLASIVVINASESSQVKVTNSYNTYNSYPVRNDGLIYAKPYMVDSGNYQKIYYVPGDLRYARDSGNNLRYYDSGRLRADTGVLGNRVDNYEVYVANKEYVGGYFKTVFYFDDYYGRIQSEAVTQYIPARSEKKFFVRDINPSRYKYNNWHYRVESMTKAPTRVYYGNDGDYVGTYNRGNPTRTYLYMN